MNQTERNHTESHGLRGLYPIIDLDLLRARGISPLAFLDAVLGCKPRLLQVRAKHTGARDTLEVLRAFAPRCDRERTWLFANDRPDLAVLAGCDGVHLGQSDLPVEEVRRHWPKLKVGLSTHDLKQLEEACATRPEYVAYGPVFATSTKRDHDPVVGLSGLREAHSLASQHGTPLVGIGGITPENAGEANEHADMLAVISGLVPDPPEVGEVRRLAVELQSKLRA